MLMRIVLRIRGGDSLRRFSAQRIFRMAVVLMPVVLVKGTRASMRRTLCDAGFRHARVRMPTHRMQGMAEHEMRQDRNDGN